MKNLYDFKEIESEVSSWWEKERIYELNPKSEINPTPVSRLASPNRGGKEGLNPKGKMYCLSMFPYPSGAGLHVGHVRIYTGTDVLARYFRMKGYDVLHPMGWDAFGLPAENAALKEKKNPMDMVPRNIETFKGQMKRLGFSYDWTRELATTDPEYYKWTQWLFIQFYNAGLLYKKDTPVYYCEFCKTGLAEEEVLANGTHERCNKPITRKNLPQWIFNITKYADSLLATLDGLDWPKGILEMQRNWIGKDKGLNIQFSIVKPLL
ncbi:MAG: class I tRNA ligase family protein, partial [Patescibacteria group bacterium]